MSPFSSSLSAITLRRCHLLCSGPCSRLLASRPALHLSAAACSPLPCPWLLLGWCFASTCVVTSLSYFLWSYSRAPNWPPRHWIPSKRHVLLDPSGVLRTFWVSCQHLKIIKLYIKGSSFWLFLPHWKLGTPGLTSPQGSYCMGLRCAFPPLEGHGLFQFSIL